METELNNCYSGLCLDYAEKLDLLEETIPDSSSNKTYNASALEKEVPSVGNVNLSNPTKTDLLINDESLTKDELDDYFEFMRRSAAAEESDLFLSANKKNSPEFLTVDTPQGEYIARKFILPEKNVPVYVVTHVDLDKDTDKIEVFQCIGRCVGIALIQVQEFCKQARQNHRKNIENFLLPACLDQLKFDLGLT